MARHSICTDFLTRLGVPHTVCFTERRFARSPYAGTLRGMQDLMSEYNVASRIERFADRNAVFSRQSPFIVMLLGKLAIVTAMTDADVTIVEQGEEQRMPRADFLRKWNGKALFASPGKESCEPSLEHHRRVQAVAIARRWGIPLCAAVIFALIFFGNGLYRTAGLWLVALFDAVGIYVCYLLLGKQLHVSSATGDAICGFLEKGGCGKIMERDVSKIFGVIGWGEVGMAYFSVSLIALLAFPQTLGYLAFFNACCLPYTVWSIAYQKFVARTWCTLCVTVQALQWLLFGSYLLAGAWHGLWPLHPSLFALGFGYLLGLLVVDRVLPVVSAAHKNEEVTSRYDNMRLRADVFAIEQQQQPETAPMEADTALQFGSPDNQREVVIFIDAASPDAAGIYRQADALLKAGIGVGLVFDTSRAESQAMAAQLTALYEKLGPDEAWRVMENLFSSRDGGAAVLAQYALQTDAEAVTDRLARQKQWLAASYLYAAPTVIVDSHILNGIYSMTDLIYIC